MKKAINYFAYITLIIAFTSMFFSSDEKKELSELHLLSDNNLVIGNHKGEFYTLLKNDSIHAFLSLDEAIGYGGPLKLAVVSDTFGNILGTEIIKSFETVSFIAKLENHGYFDQYKNKKLNDKFQLDDDIQAISGATVSSRAIAKAARDASYKLASNKLNLDIPDIKYTWTFGYAEIIVIIMLILGFVSTYLKNKKLKYINLFLGLVFIGFVLNASLSLTHIGRTLLGYFPDIHHHLIWWLLVAGTFTVSIVFGRNIYCNTMCPFRASQMLLHQISGINLKLPKNLSVLFAKTPMFLLWLSLMLIFISANPSVASYEPFAMMFSLKGHGIQWYILPASLIGALFFSNFFCRFFCPVGGSFRWILQTRKSIVNLLSKK